MPDEFEDLLEALRSAQRAFNAGDLETAFAQVAPVRVREFESREDALRAVGLEE